MIYIYSCYKCGDFEMRRPVEQRNEKALCPKCSEPCCRSISGEIKSKVVITWKEWCSSTGWDFAPTKEQMAAREKSFENVSIKKPYEVEKAHKAFFENARKEIEDVRIVM